LYETLEVICYITVFFCYLSSGIGCKILLIF